MEVVVTTPAIAVGVDPAKANDSGAKTENDQAPTTCCLLLPILVAVPDQT